MHRNWTERLFAWVTGRQKSARTRRSSKGLRLGESRMGAMVEMLETRRVLTNLVAVNVSGGAVTLSDVTKNSSTGDSFSVSYNATQVILNAQPGTMFQVGGQDLSTYTANVTGPISLAMTLNASGNAVNVIGDGTTTLSSFTADFSDAKSYNALTLANVVTNSVDVTGGRSSEMLTLQNCTVNNNLTVDQGNRRNAADAINLQNTTVKGNADITTDSLVTNQSTITGTLNDTEKGRFSTFTSTSSTYTGATTISMGRDGTMSMNGSSSSPNKFQSSVTVTGKRSAPISIYEQPNSVTNAQTPTLTNANVVSVPAAPTPPSSLVAPTVNSLTSVKNTSNVTGTYDATNAKSLVVTANNVTYTLGTSSQLTATGNNWTLNLSNAPLPTGSNTVTATTTDSQGTSKSGTGTVTPDDQLDTELGVIHQFETTNNLTAKETASGLNYVITTPGTGAVPTSGQTLTVNYSGFLMNSNGTQGTEFDSNVDAQFNHVSPFTFTLGQGQVIKGWDEAFALLPVGTVATLIIPSKLAYGTSGTGTQGTTGFIPGDSTLIFKVTLVSAA